MAGFLVILLLVLFALAAVFFLSRSRRKGVEEFRSDITGELIDLKQGQTHAVWSGDPNGPVLVCIHGLATPSYVFDALVPYLTDMGYQVLRYDLYGRGHSDRVFGRQTKDFHIAQLENLLEAEAVVDKVTVLGFSMGGAIAAGFAAKHADKVEALILLAPAGLDVRLGKFADFVSKWPILGDWLQEVLGGRSFKIEASAAGAGDSTVANIHSQLRADVMKSGHLAAMLSSQRGIMAEDQSDDFRTLGTADFPVLAIWARDDTVIPIINMGILAQLCRRAIQIELPDCDHGLVYTHPASIAEVIEDNL